MSPEKCPYSIAHNHFYIHNHSYSTRLPTEHITTSIWSFLDRVSSEAARCLVPWWSNIISNTAEHPFNKDISLTISVHKTVRLEWPFSFTRSWPRQNRSCIAIRNDGNAKVGSMVWQVSFCVHCYFRYQSVAISHYGSALQDRKQVHFFWIPSGLELGDQSIFGLASFNFNSDPTCSVLPFYRLSIVNSLRSVHWRKFISTLRMVNPFRMILPVGMTSIIYRLLVLQVHLWSAVDIKPGAPKWSY